jgi:hypothetical protein
MLIAKHLSNEYWAEAVATTLYMLNKCPTKSVRNIVPHEAWTGSKHNVAHLKVFGCVTYTHVPDELRRKMDNKGKKYIFVGNSEETKGYKLYDPVARKVIINRDVQFMQNEAWDGTITKTIKIIDAMEHDDTEDEVVQRSCTCQCAGPSTPGITTQITMQNTPVRTVGVQSTPRA